ncbi:MAG: J domain-containing protein [Spirochaetales bacterium]|nr:J domain-containing protein [Spirochaetales bacterium]
MDGFFDRLGDLLKALVSAGAPTGREFDARDPDFRAALEELDAYLDAGGFAGAAQSPPGGAGGARQQHRSPATAPPPESLRRDYANLEVPFGTPFPEVQKSYRALLRKYHPDRFAGDAEKLKVATDITQRLNESYQNLRRHHRDRAGGP